MARQRRLELWYHPGCRLVAEARTAIATALDHLEGAWEIQERPAQGVLSPTITINGHPIPTGDAWRSAGGCRLTPPTSPQLIEAMRSAEECR